MPDPITAYLRNTNEATRQARQQDLKANLSYLVSLTLQQIRQRYPSILAPSHSQHADVDLQSQVRELAEAIKQLLAWLSQRETAPALSPLPPPTRQERDGRRTTAPQKKATLKRSER